MRFRFSLLCLLLGLASGTRAWELTSEAYRIGPADSIQEAVDAAATNATIKTVEFKEGIYLPQRPGPALVYLNRRHDGLHLKALGRVTLTAANSQLASPSNPASPAIVNHILYLGDGLSSNTIIEGFRLTGANHYVSPSFGAEVEPDREIRKGRFYYCDGGAIKIYHRSSPTLLRLQIEDNYASPCAGGISIQQEGASEVPVLIQDCKFINNRAEVTGGALDLLWGSSAQVANCVFVSNVSNTGPGEGYNPFTNNGVVTVFPRSKAVFRHCTFTGNRNGVDDMGGASQYLDCLFYENRLEAGLPGQRRFELDLQRGGVVRQCVIKGPLLDPLGAVSATNNLINPPGLELGAD
ncbi:MAG TPA: right-handed parallel beta-helix repeat-containing protein, partial [Verrucomicrobiae bacterium]|nr:right-handed parallel beta-helix repeat-containing protein [Verrucomicrobiae bacterium]